MITGLLFVQAVAFAVLSGIVASNKNRDPAGWGALGFLFGLFAFIAVLVLEKVEPNEEQRSATNSNQSSTTQEFDPDEHEKKCPVCAEYIKLEAQACKHCGHEFSEEEVEQKIEEVKLEHKRTTTKSQRETKSVPDRGDKSNPPSDPSNTYSTSDRPDTYAPDTSRTKRWVITLLVFGGIIVIIIAIAIQQAG